MVDNAIAWKKQKLGVGPRFYPLLHAQGTPLKVAQAQLGHSHMATTLEVYTHTSGSAQRDAVNMLADQLFPIVPKLDGSGNTAQEETQVIQ